MKVFVTSQGQNLESNVDQRFGRCKWFVLFDTETSAHEAIGNEQSLSAGQGAGIHSAEKVSNSGAEIVITGNCGPKAFRVLRADGIRVFLGAEGTVAEVLKKFAAGELKEADEANVEGSWA